MPYPHLAGWGISICVVLGLAMLNLAYVVELLRNDASLQIDRREQTFVARTDLAVDHAQLTFGAKAVILFVGLAGLLWLIWQYQAHSNLRALVPTSRFHPLAGIASWLVPGVNLVAPLFAIRELWRGSDPYGKESARLSRWASLVWLWWASWIAGLAMVALAYRDTPLTGATADQLIARDHRLVIASLIGVVAAIPAMILINKIEGRLSLKEEGARIPEWRPWTALR